MRSFARPSEIGEPIELLRAGALFHARGLINTRAIQNNLDWVWPYWVERQFNPADPSFIPRAFSFSHVNLTYRNWTAVGLPDVPFYSIVDPRGLVTPFHDSWSLDFWLIGPNEQRLLPSKLEHAEQRLILGENIAVTSLFEDHGWSLRTDVMVEVDAEAHQGRESGELQPQCVIRIQTPAPTQAFLAVALRPYNPEGISFIDSIRIESPREWTINRNAKVYFSHPPTRTLLSNYAEGDVAHVLECERSSAPDQKEHAGQPAAHPDAVVCPVSMATGAALFLLSDLREQPLEVRVPILNEITKKTVVVDNRPPSWKSEIAKCSRLQVPDPLFQMLYDAAVVSLVLHSPGEVFPGPYTYKRFWYRDAAFILNALTTLGAHERTRHALDRFPLGQTARGYFRSQDGEWDSNGEALWIMRRYLELSGASLPDAWRTPIEKAARWITQKRLPKNSGEPHAGLLPAGFSAEHLGPNDFYYWDDFWGVAGLRAAAEMLSGSAPDLAKSLSAESEDFWETIVASFRFIPTRRHKGAIAASPYRRMDAGAIGSIVADYPLQLFAPGDERVLKTVNYLVAQSSYRGGFFQNMIHSGINAYLTLHLAQVLLRAGDARAFELVDTVAKLASPTGQWPEAIHPHTGGGCMGDGHHVWASAEWAMMIRNLFVREEGERLIIGSGIFPRWLEARELISFGPTATPFGPVTVQIEPDANGRSRVHVNGEWRGKAPRVGICIPGYLQTNSQEPKQFLSATHEIEKL